MTEVEKAVVSKKNQKVEAMDKSINSGCECILQLKVDVSDNCVVVRVPAKVIKSAD